MIKRLLVLNGTEGHDFEVGKRYIHFGTDQVVKEIKEIASQRKTGYRVLFENYSSVEVITSNIMVFYENS